MKIQTLSLFTASLLTLLGTTAYAQCQVDELNASDGASGDRYGTAVDICGDLAIVGGPRNDDGASNAGSVYIYRFDGANWVEEQKLLDPMPSSNYRFGSAVSIEGDVAVIGLPDDDDFGTRSGSVQVWRFDGATWNFEQEIFASDVSGDTRFGWDVDIDGGVFVVGAKENDENMMFDTGAAYIFRHNGLTWVEEQKIVASDNMLNAQFGDSVAINGTNIIIGAWQDPDGPDFSVGAAYVFTFDGMTWSEQQKLRASDQAAFNFFGRSVDILGDLAVVGADSATGQVGDAGAAYIFTRTGTVWTEAQKIFASDGEANDDYGNASAICNGGTGIAIGARSDNLGGTSAGSVYLYEDVGGTWTETDRVVSDDLGTGDDLGEFLAADGDNIIAGAKDNDSNGAAYVFSKGAQCAPMYPSSCNGDGGNQMGCTDCPCGNNTAPGTEGGCINSSGSGTRLIATGDPSISLPPMDTTDLRFGAEGAPPNAFGVLLSGNNVAPTGMANPCFGLDSGVQAADRDGLRCAVGSTQRHGGRSSDINGEVGITNNPWGGEGGPNVGLAVLGGFAAGQTRQFQLTHREDALQVCMRGLNTSQAVQVTFTP